MKRLVLCPTLIVESLAVASFRQQPELTARSTLWQTWATPIFNRDKALTLATVALSLLLTGSLHAQQGVRGHVFLPPTQGATVLSTYIDAQARRAVAIGDFLESQAIARKIHLEADRMAMENSVLYVETYFERRKLNREYRDAERIDYRESQILRTENFQRRIQNGEKGGNLTDEINFMMACLLADPETSREILLVDDSPLAGPHNLKLTPNDLTHILLKTRHGGGGSRPFRASDPQVVSNHWPRVFLRDEFSAERAAYNKVRDRALQEIRTGELSVQTLEALQKQLKLLEQKFERVYVYELRKDSLDLATFVALKESGRNFLRGQAAGALRAFKVGDVSSYTDDLRFDGDALVELMRHCSQRDLALAAPEPADEAVYSRIHQNIRGMYLALSPAAPEFNLDVNF